ncbi:putative bifunctional diguanylate cyclase/phosphodiesterase [Clostridioides difficile]|uniref:putative bifunctional diguanylate cyclase/phosphodiesterase n=1 Tax=Clostridioides difficile TaxID=1496 RepID=UPI0004148E14|nr:bifunctional diguanylate cyclase/phosphodiesterase [Clostridioides difficile]MBN3332116.1 bifunctional diguanylate cyclase/phosphodiesterase [Clostridioides difficile]MCA0480352.1 bifunctional diguanylate cyclase/phosphodiesterase [Clostridioides difficile]HBF8128960.1 bifunctional diguanylate cyclase/phosphodiesterase [Clostridioides difficile]HBG0864666.1 bifunctional diguanylate cyclase/phosphodiesterase [Clostridioides difficile]HBH0440142.1 bifunctional diguanylate cyclase/phosphodiest
MRNLQKKLMFFLFICIILQITYTTPVYSLCKLYKNNSINNFESIVSNNQLISKHAIQIILIMAIICVILIFYIIYDKLNFKIKLQRIAYTDNLTGANTIDKFVIDANKILCKNTQVKYALLYIDIDKFKYINDLFGYEVGNEILRNLTKIIKRNIFEEEMFARISADNFIIIMKYIEEDITKRLKTIFEELDLFNNNQEEKYKLVLSCGIYFILPEDRDINSIIDRANIPHKMAKGGHKSSYAFYDNKIHDQEIKEKEMENTMFSSLENKEFIIYLQPKIELNTGEIQGSEALVRWKRPDKGLIPPNEFIPFFERNGFVINLDLYVLEEVCIYLRKWIDAGINPVTVSVNVSRIHLYCNNFIETYKNIIDKYNIPAKYIELELTESIIFDNFDILIDIMNNLKKIGFLISMDDFGSGYSSLNMLKEIPMDILKLDQKFIMETYNSKRSKIIVTKVIEMAKELGMKVISEGVETEEQFKLLKEVKCDMAQGYLFGKPMPIEEFEHLIVSNLVRG